MTISLAVLPMLWLNVSENSKWKKFIYIAPMVVIGIGIIIGVMLKKESYLEEELVKNGINTIGIITGFEKESHNTNYATFKYRVNGKEYIQRIEYYDDTYKIGDNLNIKSSKINPEMFKIIKVEK